MKPSGLVWDFQTHDRESRCDIKVQDGGTILGETLNPLTMMPLPQLLVHSLPKSQNVHNREDDTFSADSKR